MFIGFPLVTRVARERGLPRLSVVPASVRGLAVAQGDRGSR